MQDFDFDYWKDLASSSPAEFELQRRRALQDVVDSAAAEHQSGLTTLVDTLCTPYQGTPLERASHAQALMMESLDYLKNAWVDLVEATAEGSAFERACLNACIRTSPMNFSPRQGGPSDRTGPP